VAITDLAARFFPKMDAIAPGATRGSEEATFTIALSRISGTAEFVGNTWGRVTGGTTERFVRGFPSRPLEPYCALNLNRSARIVGIFARSSLVGRFLMSVRIVVGRLAGPS
jgi:hypothetical protein